jgi:hypothetical protein
VVFSTPPPVEFRFEGLKQVLPQPAREITQGGYGGVFPAFALPALVAIDLVAPQIDDGRFPIKHITGEEVRFLFHPMDNEQLIACSKVDHERSNVILVIALDFHHTQTGGVDLPLADLGLDPQRPYHVHDRLTDTRYLWNGSRNYVEINPHKVPAHIFVVRRWGRTERDFDYCL